MRKQIYIASIVLVFLIQLGCATLPTSSFSTPAVIEHVRSHICAIAVYYNMPPAEWERRMNMSGRTVMIPLKDEEYNGKPIKTVAYIGSGTLLQDNYILSVRHLFDGDTNTYSRTIWVFFDGIDHPIEADLIAMSEGEHFSDDYAVIRLREDLGREGIRFAHSEPRAGQKIMYGGSTGGTSYFLKFGYASKFKWFFKKDADGGLHLSFWNKFYYTAIYPGGPGDSGSGIFDTRGRLVGVTYCGVNIYEEQYLFSNPLEMAWDFLVKHHLEYLVY